MADMYAAVRLWWFCVLAYYTAPSVQWAELPARDPPAVLSKRLFLNVSDV